MAERTKAPSNSGQLKNLLLVLEHARADAWLRKDRRALDALITPDFVEINSLGRFSRSEVLERLFPSLTLHEFTIEEPVLLIEEKGAGIISYRCHESLTVNGKQIDGRFRVIATYVQDNNRYRLRVWEIRPVT